MQLQVLEDRIVPDGMSLVGNFDNGTALYSDGWGESNYAYIGHYSNNNGIQIVDISDPTNPTLASTFLSNSGFNDFRDLEVKQIGNQTIGFFSSDTGGGVTVVDVTDHANPQELYRITSADGGTNTVHTLSVDGIYLYEADSRTPNIRVFDVSDPANPVFVRIIHSDSNGPVHEVTALNGRLYTAVINSQGASEVYDITNVGDPDAPVPLLTSIPSGSYAHTAWPTEDGNFVAVARETQGGDVRIWDIRDPSNPVRVATISLPLTETYSMHQVMITGNKLYISAYEAGVLVYDITDPANPAQVGSYQTYHGPVNGYDGCWGVFPFLGQDRILAFDMRTGIYVLSLDSGGDSPHGGPGPAKTVDAANTRGQERALATASHGPLGAADSGDRGLATTPFSEHPATGWLGTISGDRGLATTPFSEHPATGWLETMAELPIRATSGQSRPLSVPGKGMLQVRGSVGLLDAAFADLESNSDRAFTNLLLL